MRARVATSGGARGAAENQAVKALSRQAPTADGRGDAARPKKRIALVIINFASLPESQVHMPTCRASIHARPDAVKEHLQTALRYVAQRAPRRPEPGRR